MMIDDRQELNLSACARMFLISLSIFYCSFIYGQESDRAGEEATVILKSTTVSRIAEFEVNFKRIYSNDSFAIKNTDELVSITIQPGLYYISEIKGQIKGSRAAPFVPFSFSYNEPYETNKAMFIRPGEITYIGNVVIELQYEVPDIEFITMDMKASGIGVILKHAIEELIHFADQNDSLTKNPLNIYYPGGYVIRYKSWKFLANNYVFWERNKWAYRNLL